MVKLEGGEREFDLGLVCAGDAQLEFIVVLTGTLTYL